MPDKITYTELLTKNVLVVISTGNIIDKAVSWGMTGVGATLIILFSNIKDVIYEFGEINILIIIGILLIALVFGFLEKILFVKNEQSIKIISDLSKYLSDNTENINNKDLETMTSEIRSRIVPWYMISNFDKYNTAEAIKNNDFIIDMGKRYNSQVECSYIMSFLITSSIIWAIVSLYVVN